MLLVHKRLLDLVFCSNPTICLLIGELNTFKFRIIIKIPMFCCLFFFQVESHVDCSLLLAMIMFRFCWFAEFSMLATFLALMGSSFLLQNFILSWPFIFVIFFILFPVDYSLEYPYKSSLVNMNYVSFSLFWKVLISP
jgi:hypothetical protein